MGLLDQIDQLEGVSEEKKNELRNEAIREMSPALTADAEGTLAKLRAIGFSEENGCTAFLKRTRRILMSADAHETGAVLMADSDLGLTGDKATGATTRDEVSLANEVKGLFDLLPTEGSDGQKVLRAMLSDQAIAADSDNRPDATAEGDPDKKLESSRSSLNKVTGAEVTGVSRSRYRRRRGAATTAGGAS